MNCREKVSLGSGSEAKSRRIITHTKDKLLTSCVPFYICENREKKRLKQSPYGVWWTERALFRSVQAFCTNTEKRIPRVGNISYLPEDRHTHVALFKWDGFTKNNFSPLSVTHKTLHEVKLFQTPLCLNKTA